MDYFVHTVLKSSQEELVLLNVLNEHQAYNTYTFLTKQQIKDQSHLSESIVRKTLLILERLQFINSICTNKTKGYYLTNHGLLAIEKILEGVNE